MKRAALTMAWMIPLLLMLLLAACSSDSESAGWVVPADESARLMAEFASLGLASERLEIVCDVQTGSEGERGVSSAELAVRLSAFASNEAMKLLRAKGSQVTDFDGWKRFNLPGSNASEGLSRGVTVGLKRDRIWLIAGGLCTRA
jgi:hypothetical protein